MNQEHPKNWNKSVEHPSEDDLLCFIDGELPSRETENLRTHLEACWHCRNRAEKFQSAISLFIDYRSQVVEPLTVSPNNWGGFSSKLQRQVVETIPPTIWERFLGVLGRVKTSLAGIEPRVMRLTTISALTLILGFTGIYFLITNQTVVSAEELIDRATASRTVELKSSDQPVLYQQLQVKRRTSAGETVSNIEVWQDIDNLRIRKVIVPTSADLGAEQGERNIADLEHILRANNYEPPPLSIVGFKAWRNSVAAKTETVEDARAEDGTKVLRLATRITNEPDGSLNGRLTASTLTVRASDYHPVEQTFQVSYPDGDQEFSFYETSFAVMSLDSLNPGFFADSVPVRVSARPSPSVSASPNDETANANVSEPGATATGSSNIATAELEVEVMKALHSAGADLGEQIEVRRVPNGPVTISGVVETPERKNQILSALGGLKTDPAVRISLSTVSEALAAQRSNKARPQPSVENVQVDTDSYPAEGDLLAHFKDASAARSFAARMTEQSSRAMNYLWAMKRLKGQFSGSQVEKLTPEARAKLLNVMRSYANSYQREIATLKGALQPVFGGGGGGSAGKIGSDAQLLQTIDQLFAAGTGTNQVVRTAFTTGSSSTSALRTAQFWLTLARTEVLAASIERYK